MKVYLLSLGVGVLVGVIYALMSVRSPAPPVVALMGLLGMLIGEQVVPTAKRWMAGEPVTLEWFRQECTPRITGVAPPVESGVAARAAEPPTPKA
jgi:XapX domain-containing protein